jgi:hypothetical protein
MWGMVDNSEQLRQALTERMKPCPMCQGTTWHADPQPVALPLHDDAGGVMEIERTEDEGGFRFPVVPVVPVVCGMCGYVALFHHKFLLEGGPNVGE